jgi:PAS domain S-box-containing protein
VPRGGKSAPRLATIPIAPVIPSWAASKRTRNAKLNNLLAAIVDSSDEAIISKDLEGVITSWNRAAERLFGYTAAEAIGRNISLIIPSDRRHEEEMIIIRLKQGDRIDHFQTVRVRKDGSFVDISVTISPIRDARGKIVGASKVAHDVTEPARLRAELIERNRQLELQTQRAEESNRLKSEFLASMSHELRTPLNSVIGFSELLLDAAIPTLSSDQQGYVQDILGSGTHLLQLINELLDISMIESGKAKFSPHAFEVTGVVTEVMASLRGSLDERGHQIETFIDPGLGAVTLDRLRFKEIMLNLVSNAIKFTDAGGRIEIRIEPQTTDRFQVRVRDWGIGIPPEGLTRLFRRFEQLDSGPARHFQGSGLGLYLTRRLVEMHGGSIAVESRVGDGSVFTVELPRCVVSRTMGIDPSPSPSPLGTAYPQA